MFSSGRRARSSRIQAVYRTPSPSSSRARLAPISRHAMSVVRVTFSSGAIRRQHCTAFLAKGVSSGSKFTPPSLLLADIDASAGRHCRLDDADFGLANCVIHHLLEVSGIRVHLQLTFGAVPFLEDAVNIRELFGTAKLFGDIGDKSENFAHQLARGHFLLLAEIDEVAIQAVPRGAPFIFHDQRTVV